MIRLSPASVLIAAGLLLATAFSAAARPSAGDLPSRDDVRHMVVQEALDSARVPPSLALAVAQAESDFVANALSSVGARGVMQIMPATARGEFGVEADALWNPRVNIRLGVAFLDQLIERYGGRWDLALSHYNGGSRVASGPEPRVIPATRSYVDKVLDAERRFARDETVRRLTARSDEADAALARRADRQAALDRAGRRPADRATRRARYLALANDALDAATDRQRARYRGPVRRIERRIDSGGLLDRIADRKTRFRALLSGG